jgi:hypothetical protein
MGCDSGGMLLAPRRRWSIVTTPTMGSDAGEVRQQGCRLLTAAGAEVRGVRVHRLQVVQTPNGWTATVVLAV